MDENKKIPEQFDMMGCLHVIGLMVFIPLAAGIIVWVIIHIFTHMPHH
jgi:hypothetical protein